MLKKILLFNFLIFWLVPGLAAKPFATKKVNKHPLKIEQIIVSPLQKENHELVTLHLNLAKEHKAYEDVFAIINLSSHKIKTSRLETAPLTTFLDKFSNGKERFVLASNGTLKFTIDNSRALVKEANLALRYQACNIDYCLLPQKIPFSIKLQPSKQKGKRSTLLGRFSSASPLLSIFFIYIFGFLTAFTPCVFPMIPITMGILGFNSTAGRLRGFSIGMAYSLGLAMTYALVGLAAALTGSFIGKAFTNPYIVWGIFFFYVFTALAMMGVFTLKSPDIVNKAFGKVENKGLWGALFAGCIAGIIASPCVGPAVAAVLAFVAQQGSPTYGFLALFSFGMGLGTLFILIGLFYGEIQSRIKAGKWLLYTKYILALLILFGAFLFIKPHLPFLSGGHRHNSLSKATTTSSLWKKYTPTAFNQALKNGHPTIIDFRADWCAACEELDEYTFSTEGFKNESKNFNLFQFDATKPTSKDEEELAKFKVFGLPTILFFDSSGKNREDLTLTGFEEWPDLKERIVELKKTQTN